MTDISSKALVKDLFLMKDLPRLPFLPWVCTFAAKLEQMPVPDMLSDPGLLSTALLNTQELFSYDAITVVFDPSLEAEACGCEVSWPDNGDALPQVVSHPFPGGTGMEKIDIPGLEKRGRLPICIEALKRINILRGKQVALLGMVTGPFTLARHLYGENLAVDLRQGKAEAIKVIAAASAIGLKLCRTYCELGTDVVVVNDEILGSLDAASLTSAAAPLKSIWNVVRFYNVRSLLLAPGCAPGNIQPVVDLQSDGVSLGTEVDGTALQQAAAGRKVCCGLNISTAVLDKPADAVTSADIPAVESRRGWFVTTEGEIPYTTSVETIQEITRIINIS